MLRYLKAAGLDWQACGACAGRQLCCSAARQLHACSPCCPALPCLQPRPYPSQAPFLTLSSINLPLPQVIEELSKGIVNKLLHGPMTALRCDGADADTVAQVC